MSECIHRKLCPNECPCDYYKKNQVYQIGEPITIKAEDIKLADKLPIDLLLPKEEQNENQT
jgi:hypothetical protein